ncbi:topless-related protein 2 [Arachis hypogaea]|uniref:topless-related protein 2 n=1 Tax=Arachis hypogaea TaxID=3818 RepID=UPI000DEC7E00|nr:topless-related protein 2 isoform X1 [Arachis hypogaea]
MSSLSRELVFLILQFFQEENLKDTIHKLQQESGYFFDMKYFEEKALNGEWEIVENYLSGFTKLTDNRYSMKMCFEIRKQKYLEALDSKEKTRALEILGKDLKVFQTYNEELYREITYLLTLENFRDNEQLSKYGDTKTARKTMIVELKKLIEANPRLNDKLVFPSLKPSRLRTLINQSLNWQHQLCKNPKPNPDIRTLFVDHTCSPPGPAGASSSTPRSPSVPAAVNPSAVAAATGAGTSVPLNQTLVSALKHSRTPPTPMNNEQRGKRLRSVPQATEATNSLVVRQQVPRSLDDLTRTLFCTLNQGSTVTSMDFHPSLHSSLLIGTASGEISFWEVGRNERPILKPFAIWNSATCSVLFQAAYAKDSNVSVCRVSWSADGKYLGVAFTKHLVHLYTYQAPNDLKEHLEVDAHVGSVNDLAFSSPHKQLCMVTCGDDKLIKVWDLTGHNLFNFQGHEAAVYSICMNVKENVEYILSSSVDGKIKAWLFDNSDTKVEYDAHGKYCTTMLYSADGTKLFCCGTSKNNGDSFLVEWNENDGVIKRTYAGLGKKSMGMMQFDTTKNRFLVAGEDKLIKFWELDNPNILASVQVDGNLSSVPRVRFNRIGSLLAVTTADGRVKIFANADGIKHLRAIQAWSCRASSKANTNPAMTHLELGEGSSARRSKSFTELPEILKCQMITLPDTMYPTAKVARLVYMNNGVGLLGVGSDGTQKLWRWNRTELNPTGKAMASACPVLWLPNSGFVMTNDVPENSEGTIPCAIISKNDSYVLSACGGKLTLFNMLSFKVMVSFMSPPPRSTCLAFHPQDNNVVAIGKEDSSIHIYNIQSEEVKAKLTGDEKCITSLAFSMLLAVLVSSDADAQIFFWSIDTWNLKKSLKMYLRDESPVTGDTQVQFHCNQINLLVCHREVLSLYDASRMELVMQWVPKAHMSGSISCATYSGNGKLIYTALTDGNIVIFNADTLMLRCRIAPSVYLMTPNLPNSENVYAAVLAANPQEPNQFAVGLSNGAIKVIEPQASRRGNNGSWMGKFKRAGKPPRHGGRACSSAMEETVSDDGNSGANTI